MMVQYLERPIKALITISLWFPPKDYSFLYLMYRGIQMFIQYIFLLFNIIYMVMAWGDLMKVMEASYLLFTEAALCLKSTTFLLNKNRLCRLLEFMKEEIFGARCEIHEKILAKQAQKMWRIYSFFLVSAAANCTEWTILPLIGNGPRHFPFKIWMPIDPDQSPDYCYYVGYVFQAIAVSMSATIFLTVDFITVSMIMFASAQLEIVVEKILTIKHVPKSTGLNSQDNKDILRDNNNILNECIRQHQSIIRFVELVENMFNVNIFFQMSGTVIIICIIGIRMTVEPPNSILFYSTINYLATMLGQLYLYCWCGNELTEKSAVLRDALYISQPWHQQDQQFRRSLWIAMECMKRPIVFRAGYFIPLSRPTFVSILRCSYSYFAVLNQANM